MDKDMKDFLSSYTSKVLPKAMGTTTDIIKFVDNFKNTLLEIKLNNELENILKKESIPGINKYNVKLFLIFQLYFQKIYYLSF